MIEIDKLRSRHKDTRTGVMYKAECNLCGTKTIRWKDEKINCSYCGELV